MLANNGIIILAAGSSSRMGRTKQLLPVRGKPMLINTAEAALQSANGPIVVVLGSNEHEHRMAIQSLPLLLAMNPAWEKGLGSSIKAGLNYLSVQDADLETVTILVCDQPSVSAAHIALLRTTYYEQYAPIIASAYSDTLGVPVLFAKELFPELAGLEDHEGAKKIIQRHRQKAIAVPLPGGGIDLDTPDEYENFIKN